MNHLLLIAGVALVTVTFGFSPSAGARQGDERDVSGADGPTAERCSAPEFRQFDFWLGT